MIAPLYEGSPLAMTAGARRVQVRSAPIGGWVVIVVYEVEEFGSRWMYNPWIDAEEASWYGITPVEPPSRAHDESSCPGSAPVPEVGAAGVRVGP